MFEKIVLRRSAEGQAVSAGQIAEAILYYQNVHVVIDWGTLHGLLKQLGVGQLLSLLKRSDFKAVYCEESLGTHTEPVGSLRVHSYVAFTFAGHQSVGNLKTRAARLEYLARQVGCAPKAAKKFAQGFLDRVPIRRLSGDHYLKGGIPQAAKLDLLEPSFRRDAMRVTLAHTPGALATDVGTTFDVIDSDLGLHVFTDADFDAINRRRAALSPALEPISIAHVLNKIQEARADLALSSFYGGDFSTSSVTSAIVQLKHAELLRRAGISSESREQFHAVTLPDCPSLCEVIDSGERSFDEFLVLLDRAGRFKEWLKSVSPDENLVHRYIRDVTSEGWLQRLPGKGLRYVMTLAVESTNPIAGVAVGMIDAFILDKLLGGWKPNHFVQSRLGAFLQSN